MGMKKMTEMFFSVKEERTRGHGVTLAKMQCRPDIRNFSQRTVLSADCVGGSSVNIYIYIYIYKHYYHLLLIVI